MKLINFEICESLNLKLWKVIPDSHTKKHAWKGFFSMFRTLLKIVKINKKKTFYSILCLPSETSNIYLEKFGQVKEMKKK